MVEKLCDRIELPDAWSIIIYPEIKVIQLPTMSVILRKTRWTSMNLKSSTEHIEEPS